MVAVEELVGVEVQEVVGLFGDGVLDGDGGDLVYALVKILLADFLAHVLVQVTLRYLHFAIIPLILKHLTHQNFALK